MAVPKPRTSVAHAMMLTDERRIDAYRRAIEETVQPGDTVLDLGAGTGILSLLAARAGASRVYAIERGRIAQLAREIIASSSLADRIEVLECAVATAALPEPADVAVTETIGHLGLDEGIAGILGAARSRLLKPQASEIPQALSLRAVPVTLPAPLTRALQLQEVAGFDLAPVGDAVANGPLRVKHEDVPPESAVGPARELWRRPAGTSDRLGAHRAELPIERDGQVSGLALLLGVKLTATVTLELALGEPSHWACPVLPLRPALDVHAGDLLEATAAVGGREVRSWRVRQLRDGESLAERYHAPDLEATLLGVRDVATEVPHNGGYAGFARAALDLVDGSRSCADIAGTLSPEVLPAEAAERCTDAVLELFERLQLVRLH